MYISTAPALQFQCLLRELFSSLGLPPSRRVLTSTPLSPLFQAFVQSGVRGRVGGQSKSKDEMTKIKDQASKNNLESIKRTFDEVRGDVNAHGWRRLG